MINARRKTRAFLESALNFAHSHEEIFSIFVSSFFYEARKTEQKLFKKSKKNENLNYLFITLFGV